MLIANQRLPDGNQIFARIMSLSKSILGKRKFLSTFRWRFVKKIFKYFFLWWNTARRSCRTFILQLQIIKNLLVKVRWLRSVPKAGKKSRWSTLFHELKSVVKTKIAQSNFAGFLRRNYSQTRSRFQFHSWIDYLKREPVCRFCNLLPVSNCIQMIGEVLTATVLVYDEMENISMDETSI